jgi:hypothetical protein
VRFAPVDLPPPVNTPEFRGAAPLALWAVYVRETRPPRSAVPVEWLLLTDEPVTDAAAAQRVIGYYQQRWKIEEWHRALKEGCGVERCQLKSAGAISRLAALLGMVAVRLLQLRDQARRGGLPDLAPLELRAVSLLTKRPVAKLTAADCLRCLAKQGGWLGRKNDPPPGWRALWKGWLRLAPMAQILAVINEPNCV